MAQTRSTLPCLRDRTQNQVMPRLFRYYEHNHVHFITTSTYHRARLFDAERFRNLFVRALGQARDALEFHFIG